jgi:hypothetical protein
LFSEETKVNHFKRSCSLINRFVNNDPDWTLIQSVEFTVHPLYKIVFSAALVLLACCLPAFAQVTSGTILGSIQDTTGAIIPGAKVTATAPTLGITRTVISADNGTFSLSQTCQPPPITSL